MTGIYGSAGESERPMQQRNQSATVLLAFLGTFVVVAAVLFVYNSPQQTDLYSTTIQFSNGQRAELSRRDFVPLSRNSQRVESKQARDEMAGLYAAAGMAMRVRQSRQQELAQVHGNLSKHKLHMFLRTQPARNNTHVVHIFVDDTPLRCICAHNSSHNRKSVLTRLLTNLSVSNSFTHLAACCLMLTL